GPGRPAADARPGCPLDPGRAAQRDARAPARADAARAAGARPDPGRAHQRGDRAAPGAVGEDGGPPRLGGAAGAAGVHEGRGDQEIWVAPGANVGNRSRSGRRAGLPTVMSRQAQTEEAPEMPLYMDIHSIDGGVAVDDVVKAHMADLQTQTKYDV